MRETLVRASNLCFVSLNPLPRWTQLECHRPRHSYDHVRDEVPRLGFLARESTTSHVSEYTMLHARCVVNSLDMRPGIFLFTIGFSIDVRTRFERLGTEDTTFQYPTATGPSACSRSGHGRGAPDMRCPCPNTQRRHTERRAARPRCAETLVLQVLKPIVVQTEYEVLFCDFLVPPKTKPQQVVIVARLEVREDT